jgi:hypothetical protein
LEIFAIQGAPPRAPVSTTPAAKFSTNISSIFYTGVKFATCANDTGGKFAIGVNNASKIILPLVSTTLVANNGSNYQTADNLK